MEQEKAREAINKQPSEEKQKTIDQFQTIFSEFKKEIKNTNPEHIQEILNKQELTELFDSFGQDLRDNQKESHLHDNENTKINLERVYKYILQKCSTKDPDFNKKIQEHEKAYLTGEKLSGQGLYYKKLMILNIFLTTHFGVFFAYNTRHLALTPNPILSAEKQQVSKEHQTTIQQFMNNLGFNADEKEIPYMLIHGKFPDTNIQGIYIANTIFIFEDTEKSGDTTSFANICHEYVHSCFDKKYGAKIKLQDTIKKDGNEYLMGTSPDGIFGNSSRYTATGLSIQEFLADAIEMNLSKGTNQIDLRHKTYNLKEHKICPIKYRNSIRLMTHLINNHDELNNIYEDYQENIRTKGEKEADIILENDLKTKKINQNGQEISCQEFINNKFFEQTKRVIGILDNFIK